MSSSSPSSSPLVGMPVSCYANDREMRTIWHKILSSKEWEERLPSEEWRGYKLQDILWSGKVTSKDWEEKLIELWKEW